MLERQRQKNGKATVQEIAKPEKIKPPKPKKKPGPTAKKRAKQEREYSKLRKLFLESYPGCQLQFQGCTARATEVHHSKGRIGKLLTDIRWFKAACHNCHMKGHDKLSAKQARKNGFKK